MTKPKKATKRRKGQSASKAMLAAVLEEIPTNWCDPLLTGPRAVIGSPPYDCRDIERLLNAVREQIRQASNGPLEGRGPQD